MRRQATGEFRYASDGTPVAVVRIGPGKRKNLSMPALRGNESAARARCVALAEMASRLRRIVSLDIMTKLLEDAAAAPPGKPWEAAVAGIDMICKGAARQVRRPELGGAPTFKTFAEEWTSGALASKWPDHIKTKKTAEDDRQRLEKHVYPFVGPVRLDEFSLDNAEVVMSNCVLKEPASRRHIAQLMHRVLQLAVYPARYIKANPLPRGFLPKLPKDKARGYLYPDEDRKLLACTQIPFAWRMLIGFLAREGMRAGEAMKLQWPDVDLERGAVKLDANKTDDPRAWALDPGVLRALNVWRRLNPNTKHIFEIDGERFESRGAHNAEQLRQWLTLAGIERAELTERSSNRIPLRLHDMRATFATCAFANGRSEAWITDRMGHKSSAQLYNYKRTARTWSELNLGTLAPLDQAIPELAQ